MSMIIAQTPKTYFGSDIQKSLSSLPGFPCAKYPGEKHLPGHNYTGPGTRLDLRLDENDKPKPDKVNTTSPPTYELIDQDKEEIGSIKTNFQLMRWANELNISPFYYCMRDEINDLKDKKAWINKAKPYFVEQIGDMLQGDLDMNNFTITTLKLPENDYDAVHKKYLMDQLNLINKDFIDDTKLQEEITKQKVDLKQLIANINPGISEDKWQQESTALETKFKTELQKELTNIKQQIENIDYSEQITNINNEVLKQEKNITTLENKLKENKKSYYFNLPALAVRNTERIPTGETKYQLEGYVYIKNKKVFSYISGNIKNIFDDSGKFIFRGKALIEILFPVKVKIDSIFFSHPSHYLNARKIFEFIKDGEYVENKELEVYDENNKPNHMYEIKTNRKYLDIFRMSIILDNDNDVLSIGDFDMILETESSPSINIIRNPTPQETDTIKSYTF
ncbi:hypothetical protein LOTGIDRAFT_157485 [Lottia gigantea]|uniref:Uncharacterized protein n=1 Tax=Lottia gigantea TaxID=225164 RepID=V4B5K6_LOTGI|nr:hypothetical protein LOTGIDRAFT_157485 [Lottia gigantea]ESP01307.1 hypothetical protein LOTGIDRAFT_157485 [Lottia gigantea]